VFEGTRPPTRFFSPLGFVAKQGGIFLVFPSSPPHAIASQMQWLINVSQIENQFLEHFICTGGFIFFLQKFSVQVLQKSTKHDILNGLKQKSQKFTRFPWKLDQKYRFITGILFFFFSSGVSGSRILGFQPSNSSTNILFFIFHHLPLTVTIPNTKPSGPFSNKDTSPHAYLFRSPLARFTQEMAREHSHLHQSSLPNTPMPQYHRKEEGRADREIK